MCSHRSRAGFTLIELTIVVTIIGILASITAPRLVQWSRDTRAAEAGPLLKQVFTLEARFSARENRYTTRILELEGGPSLASSGKHYSLGLVEHASGFCAVATPNDEGRRAGVPARSMDATGTLYESEDCT